jgi:hypothetical protein
MSDLRKIRYRAVIEFLTLENAQPQEIHVRMGNVDGKDAPSYATVKRLAPEFHRGRTSLQDDPRSGHPAEAVNEENCQAA